MPNMRVITNNAADRTTLTASTVAGALVAANLLTDRKSAVWRSTGTSATLTGTTTTTETAACVHLPFCNLSPTATIRVRLYSDTAGTTLVLDTGVVLASPAAAIALRGWTAAAAASAYSYGGGAHARIWFAATSWKRFVVDISDASNLQGYIEAARLVVGPYWSPIYNAAMGASIRQVDSSRHYRTDAGELLTDAGSKYRSMQLDLNNMAAVDRKAFIDILRGCGMVYPILVSLFPSDSDVELERDHTIYGKLTDLSAMKITQYNAYSSSLEVEEI